MRYTLPLTLLVVAVTGALSSDTNKGLQQFSEMANTGDCLVRTVEIEGLRYGLASFFNANRYTVLMDNRIVLTPVRGNSLRFLRWQSSDAWSDYPVEFVVAEQSVRPTIYEKKRNTYPLSEEIVLKDAGEPVSRHVCGDLVVLTYK